MRMRTRSALGDTRPCTASCHHSTSVFTHSVSPCGRRDASQTLGPRQDNRFWNPTRSKLHRAPSYGASHTNARRSSSGCNAIVRLSISVRGARQCLACLLSIAIRLYTVTGCQADAEPFPFLCTRLYSVGAIFFRYPLAQHLISSRAAAPCLCPGAEANIRGPRSSAKGAPSPSPFSPPLLIYCRVILYLFIRHSHPGSVPSSSSSSPLSRRHDSRRTSAS